jgi:hypothetical protein
VPVPDPAVAASPGEELRARLDELDGRADALVREWAEVCRGLLEVEAVARAPWAERGAPPGDAGVLVLNRAVLARRGALQARATQLAGALRREAETTLAATVHVGRIASRAVRNPWKGEHEQLADAQAEAAWDTASTAASLDRWASLGWFHYVGAALVLWWVTGALQGSLWGVFDPRLYWLLSVSPFVVSLGLPPLVRAIMVRRLSRRLATQRYGLGDVDERLGVHRATSVGDEATIRAEAIALREELARLTDALDGAPDPMRPPDATVRALVVALRRLRALAER